MPGTNTLAYFYLAGHSSVLKSLRVGSGLITKLQTMLERLAKYKHSSLFVLGRPFQSVLIFEGRLWPYSQALYLAGKACQVQIL
jgi:hypothetical protein